MKKKKRSVRVTRRYAFESRSTGKRFAITVSAPRSFWGVWRLSSSSPRRRATATLKCGTDGRIKFLWWWPLKDKADAEIHGAMQLAAAEHAARMGAAGMYRSCRAGRVPSGAVITAAGVRRHLAR